MKLWSRGRGQTPPDTGTIAYVGDVKAPAGSSFWPEALKHNFLPSTNTVCVQRVCVDVQEQLLQSCFPISDNKLQDGLVVK